MFAFCVNVAKVAEYLIRLIICVGSLPSNSPAHLLTSLKTSPTFAPIHPTSLKRTNFINYKSQAPDLSMPALPQII